MLRNIFLSSGILLLVGMSSAEAIVIDDFEKPTFGGKINNILLVNKGNKFDSGNREESLLTDKNTVISRISNGNVEVSLRGRNNNFSHSLNYDLDGINLSGVSFKTEKDFVLVINNNLVLEKDKEVSFTPLNVNSINLTTKTDESFTLSSLEGEEVPFGIKSNYLFLLLALLGLYKFYSKTRQDKIHISGFNNDKTDDMIKEAKRIFNLGIYSNKELASNKMFEEDNNFLEKYKKNEGLPYSKELIKLAEETSNRLKKEKSGYGYSRELIKTLASFED